MAKDASLHLHALLATTVDAVITIDASGTILSFNGAAEHMFGYPAEEAIGQSIRILMTESDRGHYGAHLERYFQSGAPGLIGAGREVTARRKDGSPLEGFLSVGVVPGCEPPRFIGVLHDLTLRQRALLAVSRERDRAKGYLEAAQTILLGLDAAHQITLINRKGCEVLGFEESELVGQDWFSAVIPAELRGALSAEFAMLLRRRPGQAHYVEHPVTTRADARRLVAWRCMLVEADEQDRTRLLCSGEDVTEARRSEGELRDSREHMTHVSRLATLGEMASSIAHEINQPLAAITNYAQASARLLASGASNLTDVREAMQQIAEQALRAGDIIRRLRSLVRNRSTERELSDLNAVVSEIEPLARADARASHVKLSFEFAEQLPNVNLDRVQIQQVVLILVRNSIDALSDSPADECVVVVRIAGTAHDAVQILVQDNGPGIEPAIVERLFMPFVTTKENGTGLGLAIARTIIEAHRGRLEYRANEPHGACFVATLPAVTA